MSTECVPNATQPCYTGPAGTEGVGVCAAGEQVCGSNGVWGACAGDVVPSTDACETPEDEDCDGAPPSCGGFVAARSFSGIYEIEDITVDATGNIIMVGSAVATDFGAGTVSIVDGFWAKYDANLNLILVGYPDSEGNKSVTQAVATDASGNIAVAGIFQNSITIDGVTATVTANTAFNADHMFIAKLDDTGDLLWLQIYENYAYINPVSLKFDSFGNVVVVGETYADVDFGGGTLESDGRIIFVVKFDGDGNHLWSRSTTGTGQRWATEVGIDASDNVYVAGRYYGYADFGGAELHATTESVLLARFDSAGNHVWSKSFGDNFGPQVPLGLAVAGNGRSAVVGRFGETIDFGGGALLNNLDDFDVFAASLDANGAHVWSEAAGGMDNQLGTDVVVDTLGNTFVFGQFRQEIHFGQTTLTAQGAIDMFVRKVDSNNGELWTKSFGLPNGAVAPVSCAAATPNGGVVFTTSAGGAVDFGGGPVAGNGKFVVVLGP